jgi:hypothetical protein
MMMMMMMMMMIIMMMMMMMMMMMTALSLLQLGAGGERVPAARDRGRPAHVARLACLRGAEGKRTTRIKNP